MGSLGDEPVGTTTEYRDAVPTTTTTKPPGTRLVERLKKSPITFRTHQAVVLLLTFFAYASFHATRKTTSIVKSVLDPQSATASTAHVTASNLLISPFQSLLQLQDHPPSIPASAGANALNRTRDVGGWAPFDAADGTAMLGQIDVAFLAVYSLGMYCAGHLGDRLDLRKFLAVGMLATGLFTAMFGAGYWLNIHSFYYFLGVQMLAGLFQSTGWPSVVAVVGNWFGKSKRGLIMGIWNAHTSVGNISGSLIASGLLKYGWGWSFAAPGAMIAVVGVVVFMFLPVSPDAVGADREEEEERDAAAAAAGEESDDIEKPAPPLEKEGSLTESLLSREGSSSSSSMDTKDRAVGFMEAWRIPGVAPFALCLFFSKLVAYTFLYWLPFYISHTAIDGKYLSDSAAGTLSTLFDVGGVLGGILAGHISDRLGARAITAASFMYCAIPALFFYRSYGSISVYWNVALMFVAGMFVNGPYALITTAVSADLGTHKSLNGNSRALATVTAIIDGTGSVGAAIGPLLTGYISASSWSDVFTMLMVSALIAGLLLTKLVMAEVAAKIEESRDKLSLPVSRTPQVLA